MTDDRQTDELELAEEKAEALLKTDLALLDEAEELAVEEAAEELAAYDYGDGNKIGAPKHGEDLRQRRTRVFSVVAYRISKAVNGSLLDAEDDAGELLLADIKTLYMAICAEAAKVDVLLRANGVDAQERIRLKKVGAKFGQSAESKRYNWSEITRDNVKRKEAEIRNAKSRRAKKRRKKR